MFEHNVRHFSQYIPEYIGCLFDDARKRNGVDHAPQPVPVGMSQREGERGQCLPAAGGDSERKQPGKLFRRSATRREDFRSRLTDGGWRLLKGIEMRV